MGLIRIHTGAVLSFLSVFVLSALSFAGPPDRPASITPLVVCIVPNEDVDQVTARLRIFVSIPQQEVMAILSEDGVSTIFKPQASIQELTRNLNDGRFSGVLLKDGSGLDNGILTQSGFISLTWIQGKTFEGFLAANNSVYPLSCVRHQ